jgi:hypothetical protein
MDHGRRSSDVALYCAIHYAIAITNTSGMQRQNLKVMKILKK